MIGSKRLTQIIKIFPIKNVETGGLVAGDESGNMHNEEMLFTKFLTEAIDRDRATSRRNDQNNRISIVRNVQSE